MLHVYRNAYANFNNFKLHCVFILSLPLKMVHKIREMKRKVVIDSETGISKSKIICH